MEQKSKELGPLRLHRTRLRFLWYDLWIGAYWDRSRKVLYICLLPMVVIEMWFMPKWINTATSTEK